MSGKGSETSFSVFQIKSQDAWDADDGEYFNIISPKVIKKTAQKVLDLHKQENAHILNVPVQNVSKNETESGNSETISFGHLSKYTPSMGVRLRPNPDDCSFACQRILDQGRTERIITCINTSVTDLTNLRRLCWSGISSELRPTVWKLLCDYLPTSKERRESVLTDKRRQYSLFVQQYFHLRHQPSYKAMFHQIEKDLNRMTLLYKKREFVAMFERILFIWSMRHPGSDYVQGINDVLVPFFVVFLSEYTHVDLTTSGELSLEPDVNSTHLDCVEADVFWCTTHLLDTIQDNYTFAQPGIQNNVSMLASLIERIDSKLYQHFTRNSVEFLQFTFRWMNNLLIRELPLRCIIRLWDTYMSEKSGFSTFHVYVCAAFLLQFSEDIRKENDFQSLMVYLQHLPTYHWTDENINMVLAEAYRLYSLFSSALHHLDFRPHSSLE